MSRTALDDDRRGPLLGPQAGDRVGAVAGSPPGRDERRRGVRPSGGLAHLAAGTAQARPASTAEKKTSRVSLEWFLPTDRWEQAPEALLRAIRRRCPEALPTRYGRWEPPQHRFDPDDTGPFIRFVLDKEDGDGLWFAARPSFGGSWSAPHAARVDEPEDERLRIAHLEVDFDGRVLEQDPRWRETAADLLVSAAGELGAFFAAAQVEPGWIVTANNRLYAATETMKQGSEHFLPGACGKGSRRSRCG